MLKTHYNAMEKEKTLQDILKEELKTMYRMIGIMKPKSEAEFIAVALPNLHTRMFELLKEIKVYVFNCAEDKDGFDFRTAERNADIDGDDKNILIDEAEHRGSVYSLQGFQDAINDEELFLDNSFIFIA